MKRIFFYAIVILGAAVCAATRHARPDREADLSPAETEAPFFGAPLEPPAGRVIHGWGQISGFWNVDHPVAAKDETELADYERAVDDHRPAMISFYVSPWRTTLPAF